MRKLLLGVIATLLYLQSYGQQDQLYYTYPFMPMTINPAYAGAKEVISFSGIYRKRPLFTNNIGATSTQQYFNFDMPIAQDKMGVGFQAYNTDQAIGIGGNLAGNLGLYGNFAYRFNMPNDGKLAVGALAGITQVPAIFGAGGSGTTRLRSSFGLGVYYQNDDWYAGVSMPNVNASSDGYNVPIFVSGGYLFPLSDDFTLKTGVVFRRISNGNYNRNDIDLHGVLWVKERFGVGIWYQNTGSEFVNKALLGSLEVQLNKMRIGYSYDFQGSNSTNTTSPANQGFHQIMLRFDFDSGNGKSAQFKYF